MNKFKQETYRTQHNIQSYDWWTPPEIFKDLNIKFDLDVAAPIGGVEWIPATKYFTKKDDGLKQDWAGTVWMNPPYGKFTSAWLEKFVKHGNGIALVFSRTDTKWFQDYAVNADALLFLRGRLSFYNAGVKSKDTSGNGSLLIGCGEKSVKALEQSKLGWFVRL